MALLSILKYPDARLRIKAKPVETVNDVTRQLVNDMLATMYAAPGIGLAATQINVHQRILVLDVSESKDQPQVFINPEIIPLEGAQAIEEGCLSVPGYYGAVKRVGHIRVKALNIQGEAFEIEARDLLSVCLQHEVDHLNGKLFIDYLSPLKRQRLRQKMEKEERVQSI